MTLALINAVRGHCALQLARDDEPLNSVAMVVSKYFFSQIVVKGGFPWGIVLLNVAL